MLCGCSVAQSCLTLCNRMDCSVPAFPVLPYLLEIVQTHVHWVTDAIQPSCPLSSESFLVSRLFTSGGQSIGALASASVLPMNIQDWFPLGLTGLILQSKGSQESSPIPQLKRINSSASFMIKSHIHTWLLKKIQLCRYCCGILQPPVIVFPGGSDGKASVYDVGDLGLIPGSGRSPGEGNGSPLQYYCLENPMDRGAWWATVRGVTKSRTWLNDSTFHYDSFSSSEVKQCSV